MRRLDRELCIGYQLSLVREFTVRAGFQGNARGQGFTAWLQKNGIPRRRAYRLIERWERMNNLVRQMPKRYSKFQSGIRAEFFEGSRLDPAHFDEMTKQFVEGLRALKVGNVERSRSIRDSVSDTNERSIQ